MSFNSFLIELPFVEHNFYSCFVFQSRSESRLLVHFVLHCCDGRNESKRAQHCNQSSSYSSTLKPSLHHQNQQWKARFHGQHSSTRHLCEKPCLTRIAFATLPSVIVHCSTFRVVVAMRLKTCWRRSRNERKSFANFFFWMTKKIGKYSHGSFFREKNFS